MQSYDYVLTLGHGNLLVGYGLMPLVCNDTDFQLESESRVRSGNYFETVAAELEYLAVKGDSIIVRYELQHLIDELLYIQRRYKIVKQSADDQEYTTRD